MSNKNHSTLPLPLSTISRHITTTSYTGRLICQVAYNQYLLQSFAVNSWETKGTDERVFAEALVLKFHLLARLP